MGIEMRESRVFRFIKPKLPHCRQCDNTLNDYISEWQRLDGCYSQRSSVLPNLNITAEKKINVFCRNIAMPGHSGFSPEI